jgi:hypothetical protein
MMRSSCRRPGLRIRPIACSPLRKETLGIRLPTKRRDYPRGSDRPPIPNMLIVSMDISDVRFT